MIFLDKILEVSKKNFLGVGADQWDSIVELSSNFKTSKLGYRLLKFSKWWAGASKVKIDKILFMDILVTTDVFKH